METDNYEVVTFINIDDEDFAGLFGGKQYPVKKNEVKQFPRFLADHFAKQLGVKILIKQKKDWGNESPELVSMIARILARPVATDVVAPMVVAQEIATEFPEIEEEIEEEKEETEPKTKKVKVK